mgnify:FL=1
MSNVALLTYDRAALFELGCATELFALPRDEFETWYQAEVVTFDAKPLTTLAGLGLVAKQITDLTAYQTLVVPSWPTQNTKPTTAMAKAILEHYHTGGRILSFCSGAFLLAELGLLDGRQATTHWRYARQFEHKFPHVQYVENVLYLFDGRLGCSAGSSAALDLGLEVIRQDHGDAVANRVARRLVLSAHRSGGQSQYAETPVDRNQYGHFSNAISWASQNLAREIKVDELAKRANMSRRSFDRKFTANFKLSPKDWLTHQRLTQAKALLEQESYDMDTIAALTGFNNATTMRHHFRRVLGTTPTRHRRQFRHLYHSDSTKGDKDATGD